MKFVNKNVAGNLVARAAAQKQLNEALTDQKIRLYMLNRGEKCADLMMGLWYTLTLIYMAASAYKKIGPTSSTVRIVRGGISACEQMAESAAGWDPINTTAISVAMDAAEVLNKQLPSKLVLKAFLQLNESTYGPQQH